MLPWGHGQQHRASRFNAGTAYITVDGSSGQQPGSVDLQDADYGKTWKLIVNGIPKSMLSYAHCVREDPTRAGFAYVGTENGIYVSYDDGAKLAGAPKISAARAVYWITVQEQFNDL
jgi:hypothetical protein